MKIFKYYGLSWVVILVFIHFCFLPMVAAADEDLSDKLDKAEESYYNGDLDIALALVLDCLREPTISDIMKLRANKLLAHILLNKEETDAAKNAVFNVLELEPDYQPTIEEEAPRYVALIEEARREYSQQKKVQKTADSGISNWAWIGAGSVAAVAAAIIFLSGNKGSNDQKSSSLPQPPDLP
jgi:hypothetical protein